MQYIMIIKYTKLYIGIPGMPETSKPIGTATEVPQKEEQLPQPTEAHPLSFMGRTTLPPI